MPFLEKEGFNQLLAAASIAERFDLAVMSTKGYSTTAGRMLTERLDGSGFSSYMTSTRTASAFCTRCEATRFGISSIIRRT